MCCQQCGASAPVRHVWQRALQPAHDDQAGREGVRPLGQRGRGGRRAAVVCVVHALRQQQAGEHVLRHRESAESAPRQDCACSARDAWPGSVGRLRCNA